MERRLYADRHGDSGAKFYALSPSSIRVWFRGGAGYEYDSQKRGKLYVAEMKRPAEAGSGLATCINQHVRANFADQL
jgi:hypothetical protein